MPFVICGGPSVDDYDRKDVTFYARVSFTIAANDAILDFPCDVAVILDPLTQHPKLIERLKQLDIPVVVREWPHNKNLGLDKNNVIEIPNDVIKRYPLSGMVACKLADSLANACGGRDSYVLGMDASNGNYNGYNTSNKEHKAEMALYEQMGLTKTINLSMHSNIKCWPKYSKLPNIKKVIVNQEYKLIAKGWIAGNARRIFE